MEYSADEKRALDALQSLPRPEASAEARERIRRAFLEGGEAARPRRRSTLRRLAPVLAAAAAIVLLWFYGSRPAERWVVLETVEGAGIEGVAASVDAGEEVGPGEIRTGASSEIALQLGGSLRIRLLPGTEMRLPPPPGRWFGRQVRVALESGEVYGTTGGAAPPYPLLLETNEAIGRVTGTTFAVFRTEEASCFCLWTGGVTVIPAEGPEISLAPEKRAFVYKDARPAEVVPITDMERMKLSMMHDAGAELGGDD